MQLTIRCERPEEYRQVEELIREAFWGQNHPDYYPRLGFRRAVEFGITTSGGKNFDAFMAMELWEGSLRGINGKYYEDPVFDIEKSEAEAYDRQFPPKEKAVLLPIEVLLDKLDAASREAIESLDLKFLCKLRERSQKEIRSLPGMAKEAVAIIKRTMLEHGYRWGEKESE